MFASDGRHGEGQQIANGTFRQFVIDMVGKYGDNARQGIKHFESDPERKKVLIAVPDYMNLTILYKAPCRCLCVAEYQFEPVDC